MRSKLWLTLGALGFGSAAEAQEGLYGHEFAATFSPLHLVVPAFEATLEYATTRRVGISAVGGLGVEGEELLWDAGVQSNGYVLGDFSTGLLVGAEYMIESFGDPGSLETRLGDTPVGDPFTSGIGVYGGGKIAAEFGITAMVHLGVAWRFEAFDIAEGEVGPLINLGVGWSI